MTYLRSSLYTNIILDVFLLHRKILHEKYYIRFTQKFARSFLFLHICSLEVALQAPPLGKRQDKEIDTKLNDNLLPFT